MSAKDSPQPDKPRPNPGQESSFSSRRRKKRYPRWLLALNLLYFALIATLTISNWIGPEHWWFGSANLYLPQLVWAVPGVLLVLLTLAVSPRRSWLPFLCLLCVFGSLMGLSLHTARAARGAGIHLRVMTYNVKWGSRDAIALAAEVRNNHPDLLLMQDSAGVLSGPLGQQIAGWNILISGQYIVASPLPLAELQSVDISFPGQHHHCVRSSIHVDGVPITLYDVHLLSPREGLKAVRHRQIEVMQDNASARLFEADRLSEVLRTEQGPLILAGDLNSPMQALACRTLLDAGLRDSFADAGCGYGYTYGQYTPVGRPFMRIDHILVSGSLQVLNCWAGTPRGSDHSPVIADLFLPISR